jgi:hypothetical protein
MISTYDFKYSALSTEDRTKIEYDVSKILENSIKPNIELFKKAVQEAVTQMYENVIVNPWVDYVRENGDSYHLINSLKEAIWKEMLKSNPAKVSPYDMLEIIRSWKNNYPEEYQQEINKEYVERINFLEKQLKEISLKIIKN